MKKTVQFNLVLDKEMRETLRETAKDMHISDNAYIRLVLNKALKGTLTLIDKEA